MLKPVLDGARAEPALLSGAAVAQDKIEETASMRAATCLCTIGMHPRRIDLVRSTGARRCSSLASVPRVLCRSLERIAISPTSPRRFGHVVLLLRSSRNKSNWLQRNMSDVNGNARWRQRRVRLPHR
jgi:hypothetical protein